MKPLKYLTLLATCIVTFMTGCQKDDPTVLTTSKESVVFSVTEFENVFKVTSNKAWSINDVPQWVTVSPKSGNPGTFTIKVKVNVSDQDAERRAAIKVVAEDKTAIVTVIQAEKGSIIASKKQYDVAYDQTTLDIDFQTNVTVETEILDHVTWIKAVASKAMVAGKQKFTITPNSLEEIRTARVVFKNMLSKATDTVSIVQAPVPVAVPSSKNYFINSKGGELIVDLKTNVSIIAEISAADRSWISEASTKTVVSKQIKLNIQPNTGTVRHSDITIKDANGIIAPFKVTVTQLQEVTDGLAVTMFEATAGKGIDIIFLGDGYTKDDIDRLTYDKDVETAIEHFFNIEPVKSMRQYFNVRKVYAYSNESGISCETPFPGAKPSVDTRFKLKISGGGMDINSQIIDEYAAKARPASPAIPEHVVIVLGNSPYYSGSTYIGSNGVSVAALTVSKMTEESQSFRVLLQHEAVGHGLGRLADEYVVMQMQIPDSEYSYIADQQTKGIYLNVSLSQFPQLASWGEKLYRNPDYPEVGMYEGGKTWGIGVWRSTPNSMMRDMSKNFNAISRYIIMARVKELAGEPFTWDDFFVADKKNLTPMVQQGLKRHSAQVVSPQPIIVDKL